jgi:hypothetical protein
VAYCRKGVVSMDFSDQDRVAAFDTLFTTNQIQKLKIFLSFLDDRWQKHMAVYIKYLELQYTLAYSRRYPYRLSDGKEKDDTGNFQALIMALIPYSDEKDRKQLEQFGGVIQTMEMFQQMAPMMELMKNMMPADMTDGAGMFGTLSSLFGNMAGGQNSGNENSEASTGDDMLTNMLKGMMTAEQREMYEMFSEDED